MRVEAADPVNAGAWLTAIVATVACGLVVAGCGGGSSRHDLASLSTTTSSRATAVQYSVCMRTHGVPNFPDPNSNGGISLSDDPTSPGYVNPATPAFGAAQRACVRIVHFKGIPRPGQLVRCTSELLRFAWCVRAHRVPNFPDPGSLGPNQGVGFLINRNTLDPHSPTLQAAIMVCQRGLGVSAGFKSYG